VTAVVGALSSVSWNVATPPSSVDAALAVSSLVQQKDIYLIFMGFYKIHFESFDPSMTLPRLHAHPKASMQRS
jgi:hypothetical protein